MSEVNPNDQAGDPAATGKAAMPNSFMEQGYGQNQANDSGFPKDIKGETREQPVNSEQANEDHHARIAELAVQLRNASPSGANTISDKILYHLNAIENPDQFNKDQAKLKEAEDKREAEQKERREALKAKAEPAKVA